MQFHLQKSILALFLAISFMFIHISLAHAEGEMDFNIAVQSLDSALLAYGSSSGVQVFYDSGITGGQQSSAVKGSYTPKAALQQLLKGTNLQSEVTGDKSVTLRIAGKTKADKTKDSTETLDTINVVGKGEDGTPVLDTVHVDATEIPESAYGAVDGYVAKRSATGSKTDTALIETPRTISVVTADQISDQNHKNISEALRYTAGVQSEVFGVNDRNQAYNIRGFTAEQFIDGLQRNSFGASPDAYGLERIEVLKGPGSTLYGQGSLGGTVNTVTKRPVEEFFAQVGVDYGSFDQVGGRFDIGGAIDDEKEFLFRLTGLQRVGETQVDFVDDNRLYIAPAFTWQPSDKTRLTLLAKYQEDDGGDLSTRTALTGSLLPHPTGQKISTHFFGGEPAFNEFYSKQASITSEFEHVFNDHLTFNNRLRYEHSKEKAKFASVLGALGDLPPFLQGAVIASFPALSLDPASTLLRLPNKRTEKRDAFAMDTNIVGKFDLGSTAHTAVLGVDYLKNSQSDTRLTGAPGPGPFGFLAAVLPIDIFNPIYGTPIPDLETTTDTRLISRQLGVYAHDQIKIYDKLVLSLGVRQDWSRSKATNKLTDVVTRNKDEAFTYQSGLTYLFDNGLAPYVSYAESFDPQSGTNFSGKAFDPLEGEQKEIGIKYEPRWMDALITLSFFDLRQKNVQTSDPINFGFNINAGEQRSRGIELEIKANPIRGLQISGGYTTMDTEVIKTNDITTFPEGKTPTRINEDFASLWVDYTVPYGTFGGFGIGGGARYIGSSWATALNTLKVPSYTLYDMVIHYEPTGALKGLRLAVNASNLADKKHVVNCTADGLPNCTFGHRRNVTASITYDF